MVDYNTIKYCRLCKKRFIVDRSGRWKYYCDECQSKINKKRKVSSLSRKD